MEGLISAISSPQDKFAHRYVDSFTLFPVARKAMAILNFFCGFKMITLCTAFRTCYCRLSLLIACSSTEGPCVGSQSQPMVDFGTSKRRQGLLADDVPQFAVQCTPNWKVLHLGRYRLVYFFPNSINCCHLVPQDVELGVGARCDSKYYFLHLNL